MSTVPSNLLTLAQYEAAARAYQDTLTYEDIMESPDQGMQRRITLASLALVRTERPDVHFYNEVLVQYHVGKAREMQRVVPDNFVILHKGTIDLRERLAFHVPLHPGLQIFWTLEYISRQSEQKDREENFRKYERELKVPYYLIFDPDAEELALWRLNRGRYASVKPAQGRLRIRELDVSVALHEGWVRFWLGSELLPLPEDMRQELKETRERADKAEQRADKERDRADQLAAELARLRTQLGLDG